MRVVAVCRGGPGLGRVVPSLGLMQTLRSACDVESVFASYAAGYSYLRAVGEDVVDLGRPPSAFIDAVAPQSLRVQELVEKCDPELVFVDGEFFLPVSLAHLSAPVIYLANPHDLIGPANTFRRVNRLLLAHCRAVIISSLSCSRTRLINGLVAGVPCLAVPAITKVFPIERLASNGPPHVLVSMGGGSINADAAFRDSSDEALAMIVDILSILALAGRIAAATVVLGADATLTVSCRPSWLTVVEGPVELTTFYADHDVFIARAGRNASAEAIYCGIPTVLIPVTSDPQRGDEQASNAQVAKAADNIFTASDWRDTASLLRAIEAALVYASTAERRIGVRGNDDAIAFLATIVNIQLPTPKGTTRCVAEERFGHL